MFWEIWCINFVRNTVVLPHVSSDKEKTMKTLTFNMKYEGHKFNHFFIVTSTWPVVGTKEQPSFGSNMTSIVVKLVLNC